MYFCKREEDTYSPFGLYSLIFDNEGHLFHFVVQLVHVAVVNSFSQVFYSDDIPARSGFCCYYYYYYYFIIIFYLTNQPMHPVGRTRKCVKNRHLQTYSSQRSKDTGLTCGFLGRQDLHCFCQDTFVVDILVSPPSKKKEI